MAVSWRGTLEGFFVGFTISLILSGMLIAQVGTFYRYHEAKPNAVTALILVIFALENGQTVFMSIGAWDYMISWHGDLSQFRSPVFAIGAIVFIATACNTLCRCIFAYSIYKLNGHRGLFPVIIIVLTLIVLVVSIMYATEIVQQRPWSENALATCFYVGAASSLAADILITACMVVVFACRGSGFGRTNKPTIPLLFYCLNTGVAASICVMGVLISYAISPSSFVWISFYLVLGKVYTNSLLGFLNAREVIFVRGGAGRQNMTTAPQFTSVMTIDRSDTPDSQFYLEAAEDDPRGPALAPAADGDR